MGFTKIQANKIVDEICSEMLITLKRRDNKSLTLTLDTVSDHLQLCSVVMGNVVTPKVTTKSKRKRTKKDATVLEACPEVPPPNPTTTAPVVPKAALKRR